MTDDRQRSFWAWGWADRLPDDDERRELKTRIESMLGFPERSLLDYPTLGDVTMPEPRIDPPLDCCTTDRRERALHTYGRGYRDKDGHPLSAPSKKPSRLKS